MKRNILAITIALGFLAASSLAAAPARAQYSDGGVKIGVLTDMSGGYSDLAGKGSVTAAQLAIEDFGRPIGGRKVELIFADHQNKADIASTIARRWFAMGALVVRHSLHGLAARWVAGVKAALLIPRVGGVLQLAEQPDQLFELVGAHVAHRVGDPRGERGPHPREQAAARRGHHDDDAAPVGCMPPPPHQPVGDHAIDHPGDIAGCDHQEQ